MKTLKQVLEKMIKTKQSINQENCNSKMLEFMNIYISERNLNDYPLNIRSGCDLHGCFPHGYSYTDKLLDGYASEGEMIKESITQAIEELKWVGFIVKIIKTDSGTTYYSIDIP